MLQGSPGLLKLLRAKVGRDAHDAEMVVELVKEYIEELEN